MQVRLRSINNRPQNASAVGTGNTVYQDLDQGSYQNQVEYQVHYNPKSEPQLQISNQDAGKMAQLLGLAMPFCKT